MDEASVEYLARLADTLLNDALERDRTGENDLAQANLDLAFAVHARIRERTQHDPTD